MHRVDKDLLIAFGLGTLICTPLIIGGIGKLLGWW